jgi:hypothetical protein
MHLTNMYTKYRIEFIYIPHILHRTDKKADVEHGKTQCVAGLKDILRSI